MRVTVIPIVIGTLGIVPKGLVQGPENLEIRRKYSIVEISLNTEKCPGDLRKLVITQTPLRNHQLHQE